MILADTHVVVWLRTDPDRLGAGARAAIESADEIAISGISLWELSMLVSHGRLALDLPLAAYLDDVSRSCRVLPITAAVATAVADLPETFPTGDPADRIIYATALVHGLPLLSADAGLLAHDETVIWL